ncbi:MAG: methionyl-tRNA formyltransferase [Alphaproteobacteria bacterium]|nr:methionyl-tRNA formyltransferase [Alphaproteobacteria bacterium]MCB9929293.1 methionyl-tRNA formyltransferase [Alphaproteobacteria bacterium]
MALRIVYMGTPDFAVGPLAALLDAGHEVCCVYSQPPRPAGRGHKLRPSPVHAFAESHGIEVRTPRRLRAAEDQAAFAALRADVAVVAAYGLILPQPVLDAPRLGCLNIHASLLPRWRGAAPIQHAILAGDAETGVTVMQMDAGLDTGAMLLREAVPITAATTASSLHDALAALGCRLIVDALGRLEAGTLTATPQPAEGATYAAKLTREDGRLDWRRPAVDLERQVRALTPWPGTWFLHGDTVLKVSAAETVSDATGAPGTVLDDSLTIACGTGGLRPTRIQRPGKAPMAAADLLRGYDLPAGTRLDLPSTPLPPEHTA